MNDTSRIFWNTPHVVDVRDAVFAARTYLEHRDLRALLNEALRSRRIDRACELGSGFGRMTPVLREFSDLVVGFEREPHFVAEAHPLHPDISFRQVARLDAIPEPDQAFSLILTFTVLQHLVEPMLRSVATEIQRLLKPGGLLVICEETDTSHIAGDVTDPNGMCTIGRSVATYEAVFPTCTLRVTRPRIIEPTYPRANVGAYMLFERPSAAAS